MDLHINKKVDVPLLKEKEAAELMKLSVHTLRNDRHLGRGCAYVALGRAIRYRRSDIDSYIEQSRIVPK